MSNRDNNLTHIAGTFVIGAKGSFLNGAGIGEGEDRNVTTVKTFIDGRDRVPYVSSQAFRRWLRDTLAEETGWQESELRSLHVNPRGNTDKIGGEFNPIDFPEDDIFGYMRAQEGSGKTVKEEDSEEEDSSENNVSTPSKGAKKGKKVKSLVRKSPLSTSILMSLRKTGWRGRDEGFVHLKEGTPLPYTTEFYSTNLQGIFSLDYSRLGIFSNIGDRSELDDNKVDDFLKTGKIKVIKDEGNAGQAYEMVNCQAVRKLRASKLLESLSKLRGGAKQAAFGTDVSPKVIIMAGLSCGNLIFNNIFNDDGNSVTLNVQTLKEISSDYKDRIVTPVFIRN